MGGESVEHSYNVKSVFGLDDLTGLFLLQFGESLAHDIADIEKPEASLLFRWCIEGRWKLLLTYDGEVNRYQSTHPRTEKGPQLFDLLADPREEENLASDHPDVVARLAGRIADWYPVTERKTQTTVTEQ